MVGSAKICFQIDWAWRYTSITLSSARAMMLLGIGGGVSMNYMAGAGLVPACARVVERMGTGNRANVKGRTVSLLAVVRGSSSSWSSAFSVLVAW